MLLPGGAGNGAERGALGPRSKRGAVTDTRERTRIEWLPQNLKTDWRLASRHRSGCDQAEPSERALLSGSRGICTREANKQRTAVPDGGRRSTHPSHMLSEDREDVPTASGADCRGLDGESGASRAAGAWDQAVIQGVSSPSSEEE